MLNYRFLISKYRVELMAFAILWIMLGHTRYFGIIDYKYLNVLIDTGSCGVDIFAFVSGFGLYFGYPKYKNVWHFYKKRIVRILPAFLLIVLTNSIMLGTFKNVTTLHFWYNEFYCNWYITYILTMYLMYPIIYKIQKRKLYLPLLLAILVSILLSVILFFLGKDDIHGLPMSFVQRIPIFVFGSLFADNKFSITVSPYIVIPSFIATCWAIYQGYNLFVYPLYFPLSISLTLTTVYLLNNFPPPLFAFDFDEMDRSDDIGSVSCSHENICSGKLLFPF